jgi:hypothetical protein
MSNDELCVIVHNPNFKIGDISKDKIEDTYFIDFLSSIIPLKHIEENPQIGWSYDSLSKNKHLTIPFIQRNIDKNWYWGSCGLSSNPLNTTKREFSKFVKENIHKSWSFEMLSRNPSLSGNVIEEYFDKDWDWDFICRSPFLSEKFYRRNFIKMVYFNKVNWIHLSMNENFPTDLIDEYKYMDWFWKSVYLRKRKIKAITHKRPRKSIK